MNSHLLHQLSLANAAQALQLGSWLTLIQGEENGLCRGMLLYTVAPKAEMMKPVTAVSYSGPALKPGQPQSNGSKNINDTYSREGGKQSPF